VLPFAGPGIAMFDGAAVDPPLWDQAWQVWDRGDDLLVVVIYRADLFRRGTVRRLLERFRARLDAALARPDDRLPARPTPARVQ
jgi:hypothetical protein